MVGYEVKQILGKLFIQTYNLVANTAPSYRKGVNVVVILDVKQHHGAPGAPSMMVRLILHKLQHKRLTSVWTFWGRALCSDHSCVLLL